jgi:hypothetical protein
MWSQVVTYNTYPSELQLVSRRANTIHTLALDTDKSECVDKFSMTNVGPHMFPTQTNNMDVVV